MANRDNLHGQRGRQLEQKKALLQETIPDWIVAGETRKSPLGISERQMATLTGIIYDSPKGVQRQPHESSALLASQFRNDRKTPLSKQENQASSPLEIEQP